MGKIEAANKVVLFSVNDIAGHGEIGIKEGTTYTTILRSASLNFNINNSIQGTYFYNYKNRKIYKAKNNYKYYYSSF
jgi:hypothetical protein